MAEEYSPASGTTGTTTSPSSAGSAGSGPDEELKKLKEAMQKDQANADKLKKQIEDRKSKIDGLEKALSATNQVSNAFAAAMQGVTADRLEIQDFLANELPQIEKQEEVKSKKGEIEAIVKQANTKIETKESERLMLEQKCKDEKTALQAANDHLAGKKTELDGLQNLQRTLQDKFNVLRKINQRIKSEGANKPLVKYVLALELKTVWEETKPLFISKEQLQASFYAKAEEVRAAAADSAAKEEKTKRAQTALDTACQELDASKAGRLDDIVKQVGALTARVPAVAGAVASAGSETAVAAVP